MSDASRVPIDDLQRDRSLFEPGRLRERLELLDLLEHDLMCAEGQHRARIERLCADLEAANARLYRALREDVGPDASIVSTDYAGLQTVLTDARGKVTTQTRNGKGELTQVVDAGGMATTYSYRADGALTQVSRDAGRGVILNTFGYDASGRKVSQNDPDAGLTYYEYNALGELIAQQDGEGNRIENEIDGRGRVWRRTVTERGGLVESQSTFDFDTAVNGAGKPAAGRISGTYRGLVGQTGAALGFARLYGYDVLGRPLSTTTTIDGADYATALQYDGLGRPWKAQDATGRWVKSIFNSRGINESVCNSSLNDTVAACPADANTYLRAMETDAWGHVVRERRGNSAAMDVVRDYWDDTGRIASICAGTQTPTAGCALMDEAYGWDGAGNLHTQQKEGRYLEQFTYDNLNRLTHAYVTMQDGVTTNTLTHWAQYDDLGNICAKIINGVGTGLAYIGRAGCGVDTPNGSGGTGLLGPHQVGQVVGGTAAAYYYYDARGNQTLRDAAGTANDRTIRYSLDDRAYEIALGDPAAPTRRTRFWYGSDGTRYKREDGSKRTLYLGNVEIVTDAGVTTMKRYVAGVMLQTIVGATATNQYLFHDQLGSLVRITDANGSPINGQDYTAFGERRDYNDPAKTTISAPSLTTRGFTGHEMVDGLGVVHMNGRIFDPLLGRFLQPDPVIQAPDNSQSWNAYTYVFNNPLRYTDPTGTIGIEERKWAAVVIGIIAACFGQYYITHQMWAAAFMVAVAGGFAAGAVASQSLKGGLIGAFGAALTFGVAQGGFDYWQAVGMQAFTGGIMEVLQGGRFGDGFLAAGVTAMVMPAVGRIDSRLARTAVGAIVGGTLSEATGGKFANGAVSGAIQAAMVGGSEKGTAEASSGGAQLCGMEPDGVTNGFYQVNQEWVDSGVLTFSVVEGVPTMTMGGVVGSIDLKMAERWATSVNDRWSGIYRGSHGQKYRVISNWKAGGLDQADWSLYFMQPNDPGIRLPAYNYRGQSYAMVNGSLESAVADVGAHEISHALGLSHFANRSHAISSYSCTRFVTGKEVEAIFKGYGH